MVYRAMKPVLLQPILKFPILLHPRIPFASYFEFVWNLWSSVVVQYRVGFPSPQLRMEPV